MPADYKRRAIRRVYKKRRCAICELLINCKEMRISPTDHSLLAVMLSSLAVFEGVDVKVAKFIFEGCVVVPKRMCHQHFSTAAKYLLAELAAVGISLSFFDTGAYLPTAPNYVSERDIPIYLVDRLNDIVQRFDKFRCLTVKDVMKFVNDSIWRYFAGAGLDSLLELRLESVANNLEKVIAESIETVRDASHTSDIKQEEEAKNSDYGIPLTELAGQSYSSAYSVKVESNFDGASTALISSPNPDPPLPKLKRTDPKLLQFSFMVDGEALLKLFQFCPQCGQKLEDDGGVRLMEDGAAPLVQYVCDRCSQEEPFVRIWKAQDNHMQSE